MSTSTASPTVHGHSPISAALKFFSAMSAAPKGRAKHAASAESTIMNLLRLSAGMNSVNPELLAERIVQD